MATQRMQQREVNQANIRSRTQSNNTGKQKGKSSPIWIWILVIIAYIGYAMMNNPSFRRQVRPLQRKLLIFGLNLSSRTGLSIDTLQTLFVILIILIVLMVIIALKKGNNRETKENPVAGRVSAAIRRSDPRNASFTKPETYCAVHNHSAEDHLAYDKRKRLDQLEEWLKIGLIERDEYRVLKDRYQRDL